LAFDLELLLLMLGIQNAHFSALWLPKMPLLLLTLLLCSCSAKHTDNTGLPNYSDMSAAEDAGKAK